MKYLQLNKNQNRAWYRQAGFMLMAMLLLLLFQLIMPDESPGPLSRFHSELEGEQHCLKCHNQDFETDPEKCLDCHQELKSRIAAGKGYHQDKDEGCDACHPEHQGENSVLIDWDVEDFDHEEAGCELAGSHQKIKDCQVCHKPPNQLPRKKGKSYLLKSSHCSACHLSPHLGEHPDCTTCHTQASWRVNPW